MNLQAQIKDELWESVRSSYEAGHYSHAIRDAMSFVTEVLREKSGLDGDGRNLVGAVLGFGKDNLPKIQLNKLETQTERDIQNGLREVLSGMYALVRNPRTHERIEDDKKTADAIISFIDLLLGYLGESRSAFTIEEFVARVSDRYFVADDQYVEALVASVPSRKRADTMIALYHEANWNKAYHFELVLRTLLSDASEVEVDYLLSAVSKTLEQTIDSSTVSLTRKLLPSETWPKLSRVARFRAEKILIEELKDAYYSSETDHTNFSAPTWLSGIVPYMSLRKDLSKVLLEKLRHHDFDYPNYVANYFFHDLPEIFTDMMGIWHCTTAIATTIGRGNEFVEDRLVACVESYPTSWYSLLAKALKPYTDPAKPRCYLPDGTPLLTSTVEEEDDIPF